MRASILAFLILSIAAAPHAATQDPAPDPAVVAAEREKKQAEAETAKFEAEKKKFEAQKAAADARWGFLPKSPAEGKTTIDSSGAVLETELLVADALASAATKIKQAVADPLALATERILIIGGTEAGGSGRLIAFQVEAYGLKNGAQRILGIADQCPNKAASATNENGTQALAGGLAGIGTLVSGLSDMLKTDTNISGKTSVLGEEQLVRAIVAANPTAFRTAYFDARRLDLDNDVMVELDCLARYRDAMTDALASYITDDQKKKNTAKIARLTAQAAAHDDWTGRLTKSDKDNPPLLAALYADAEIAKSTNSVLRVWVDASGGTLINRRSLWTNFGATAVSMTGGAVISYLLISNTGDVKKAGLLRCNTKLVSLRGVHKIGKSIGNCESLTP